jgi:hypothetical protein
MRLVSERKLRQELAEIYGKAPHPYTVRKMVQRGMPVKAHPWNEGVIMYDLDEVLPWIQADWQTKSKEAASAHNRRKTA